MSARVIDYINSFMKLLESSKYIIDEIKQVLIKIEKQYMTPFGADAPFNNVVIKENTIDFRFLDFNVCIELEICTSKEIGFIKWYRIYQDCESKPKKTMIIKDSFDNQGNIIKISWEPKTAAEIKSMTLYFVNTLMIFCEKIDQTEFTRKVDI